MNKFSLAHLADASLMTSYSSAARAFRGADAMLLAHIAEVDERKLYVLAGYASMFLHATQAMGFSEDAAAKRIQAARSARRFPRIFELVETGRLHLTGVCMLSPVLDEANAEAVLDRASGKSCAEIRLLLAELAPKADLPAGLTPVASPGGEHAAQHIPATLEGEPQSIAAPVDRPRVEPLAPQRFALQVTIGQATHDRLRRAQELLGFVGAGAIEPVLDRALDALIEKLERRKLGATSRPRARRSSGATRYVPSEARREVWQRDGGRCTFVSTDGHRCDARSGLEFDHVQPVAQGGRTTTANLRLRCRAHNQYEAERAYGAEFMRARREEARAWREAERSAAEVLPWLRQLGVRVEDARRAIALGAASPDSPLETRVRAALRHLGPPAARRTGVAAAPA